jgi:hypothetical protein
LTTSRVEDPDLALIVGLWDRLTDECKRRVIEMVQADPPSSVDAGEFDEIDERGGELSPGSRENLCSQVQSV